MGLGGLIDPAAEMGLPYDETNFDETFYRWGLPEGGYWELPLSGRAPSATGPAGRSTS